MKGACYADSDLYAHYRVENPARHLLIHVVERHLPEPARVAGAVSSWKRIYDAGGMLPIHATGSRRNAKLLGDSRDLPYLKDIMEQGIKASHEDSVIVFTNGDIVLHPELPRVLEERMGERECACSFRITLDKLPTEGSPEYWASLGQPDFGRDLFAFKRAWLVENWGEIPNLFVGEQEWDLIVACMVRLHNGVEMREKTDLAVPDERAELPLGYVLHQRHVGGWLARSNLMAPAKLYNVALANKWYCEHGLEHFKLPL